jgi:hypothetical protein
MDSAWLEKLHDETLVLLEEARNYARDGRGDIEHARTGQCTVPWYAFEISRVSTLLIDAMAWILVWRAVDNEEMTRHEALEPEWRLMRKDLLDDGVDDPVEIDPRLIQLADASLALHQRLRRLERRLMDA